MTPEKIEQERKAFEEWYYDSIGDTRFPLDKHENGCYCNPIAEDMFTTWCAAKSHSAQSEWISVEDEYPKDGQEVNILLNTGEVRIALHELGTPGGSCFTKGHYFTGDIYHIDGAEYNCSIYGDDVTHWQSLPEPPETRGK